MVILNDAGEPIVNRELLLQTRQRNQIPNDMGRPRPKEAMESGRDLFKSLYVIHSVRSLSSIYNCLGLPFASRRTVIQTQHLEMILRDDQYRQISQTELERGDIVVYRDEENEAAHVGIVHYLELTPGGEWNIIVLSQWGRDGEYVHPIRSVPEAYGTTQEFWTDRYEFG